jgi:hypothetical protein
VQHIEGNTEHYDNLLNMHHHLQQAKNVLVKNLEKNTGGLEHHIDGKPTGPEGFVVNYSGEPTKLVNRSEFAKANLLKVRKPSVEDKPKKTSKKTIKVDYENDPQ